MKTAGEAFIAERAEEEQEEACRLERVRAFINGSDPELIADLFAALNAAVLDRETREIFALTSAYKSISTILRDVEAGFFATQN